MRKYSEDNVILFGTKMMATMLAMKQAADILATVKDMRPTEDQHKAIMEKVRVAISAAKDCARHLDGEEDPKMKELTLALEELAETDGSKTNVKDAETLAARVRARAKQALAVRV